MMDWMNDNKGVISIFLILIMIPVMVLSAVLVDGSRMRSAEMIIQEAADLAAISVLTDYNKLLKNEYGLFALDNANAASLKSTFDEYLNKSLVANAVIGDKGYSDKVFDIVQNSIFGESPYADGKFLNLYDFTTSGTKVTPMYSLANQDVLQSQIVEYTKYRGVKIIAERFELLNKFQQFKDSMKDAEQGADLINKKYQLDKEASIVAELIFEIKTLVDNHNARVAKDKSKIPDMRDDVYDELEDLMEKLKEYENIGDEVVDYNDEASKLTEIYSGYINEMKVIRNKCASVIREIDVYIDEYEKFQASIEDDKSELAEEMKKSIPNDINNLNENKKIIQDFAERLQDGKSILRNLEETVKAPTKIRGLAERFRLNNPPPAEDSETEPPTYKFDNFEGEQPENTESIETALIWYRSYYTNLTGVDYSLDLPKPKVETGENLEDDAKQVSEKVNDDSMHQSSNSEPLSQAEQNSRPSKSFDPVAEAKAYGEEITLDMTPDPNFEMKDYVFDKDQGEAALDNIMNSSKSLLGSFAEATRDEILTYTYVLGTFKTRMTEKGFNSKNAPDNLDKPYITEWRYLNEDGEQDLRGKPKVSRASRFNFAEVEYIIVGQPSEATNKNIIYATIYGTRLANNLIAVYLNNSANKQCLAAAGAASAATGGLVPVNVFHWIFMAAWAAAETYIEMELLINKGYRLPLIKTNQNLLATNIVDFGLDKESQLEQSMSKANINVCYEDYLIILMSLLSKKTRLMRVADLIQLNMVKAGQSNFEMKNSFTYVRAEASASIRYLFMPVEQFSDGYGKLNGRIPVRSIVYQGY